MLSSAQILAWMTQVFLVCFAAVTGAAPAVKTMCATAARHLNFNAAILCIAALFK